MKKLITVIGMVVLPVAGVFASPELDGAPIASKAPIVSTTPSGSYLTLGERTLFIPGVQLEGYVLAQLRSTLGHTVYRKFIHHLFHLGIRSIRKYIGIRGLAIYMAKVIPATLNAYTLYQQWPRFCSIIHTLWERVQTCTGWRRRGRMPVFPGLELDGSVFIDYLVQTHEADDGSPWQLEIAPLKVVNATGTLAPWQEGMAELINTAIENDIDLIRVKIGYDGEMVLSWHNKVTQEWQESALYGALEDEQKYMAQWLENSWKEPESTTVFSSLEPVALSCIQAKLTDPTAVCQPLTGLKKSDVEMHTYSMESGAESTHITMYNNWLVYEPGYLTISPSQTTGAMPPLAVESRQYRMSRASAAFVQSVISHIFNTLSMATVGAAMDKALDWWQGAGKYTLSERLSGVNDRSKMYKVKDRSGKTLIQKEGPLSTRFGGGISPYVTMGNEMLVLEQIDHENVIKIRDHWLKDAGTPYAKMMTIYEAGKLNLQEYKINTIEEFKDITRQSLLGIGAAHNAGVVHSDIQPSNLLLMGDGTIKLIDFGSATHTDSSGNAPFLDARTSYLAPEINYLYPFPLTNKIADIWSYGLTNLRTFLYSNVCSTTDFEPDFKLMNDAIINIRSRKECIQRLECSVASSSLLQSIPNYSDFLSRMLTTKPENRNSVEELLHHPFLQTAPSQR